MTEKKCLFCTTTVSPFMSFGRQPIANGFLCPDQYAEEYFFEMEVAACPKCGCFQLLDQPAPEQMFNENYAFFSGTSNFMAEHFRKFAVDVQKRFLTASNPFVVEMGSNDGILLRNFANQGVKHLGVEPSKNVADRAIEHGVNSLCKFFSVEVAREIVSEQGHADAFLAANCMCHIPNLHSIVEGISELLKPDGVAVFEDPYLGDVIENTSYDQIYDEHTFIFSVNSLAYLFSQYGMEIFDVEPQPTHGGSMRYFVAKKGRRPQTARLEGQLLKEKQWALLQPHTYVQFREKCEQSRRQLQTLLKAQKKAGKRVVGYAATSKSTTILNYCDIGPDLLPEIYDTTPLKHGKFSPGKHIPISPYQNFQANYPDFAFLFAWNHFKEIMEKEKLFEAQGGQWILHVPEVHVL